MDAIRKLAHAASAAAAPLSRRQALYEQPLSCHFGGLPQALRAEIDSMQPHLHVRRPTRDDIVESFILRYQWDEENTFGAGKDLLLRRWWRRTDGGSSHKGEEEVAVSAVLGPVRRIGMDVVPGTVFMKVCVKKDEVGPVVVFDCEVVEGVGRSDFAVRRVSWVPAGASPDASFCRRQIKSSPNDALQLAFKNYLVDRGVNSGLTDFLLQNMRVTEDRQYVFWLVKYLQILESMT